MAHHRRWSRLGVDIAKAALTAGHAVVATGRDATKVAAAVGDYDNLLVTKLDVTRPQDAEAAVEAAVATFGRIDILVNNAGNFFAGFFEELSPEQVRNQIETLLFGPMNVTRAALPVMRKQRSGLLVTISSTAGLPAKCSVRHMPPRSSASRVGWSRLPEIAAFGIRTMLVEPGFFRTELLSNDSTTYAQPTVDGYAERTNEIVAAWKSMDGRQGGDPAKLAKALVALVPGCPHTRRRPQRITEESNGRAHGGRIVVAPLTKGPAHFLHDCAATVIPLVLGSARFCKR